MHNLFISLVLLFTVNSKTGIASYYSDSFHGKRTASGEIFSQHKLTAASNNYKLGTQVKVTNINNNKTVIVKINDRMAPSMARKGRVVDLTKAAAKELGFYGNGLAQVKVENINEENGIEYN